MPRSAQLPPCSSLQPGKSTLACVKVRRRLSRSTPRSIWKLAPDRCRPTSTRPRPSVWARSPNTGPAEKEVRTRSEERRVGKECRSRWAAAEEGKKEKARERGGNDVEKKNVAT